MDQSEVMAVIVAELERLKAVVEELKGPKQGGRSRKSQPRMSVVVLGSEDFSSSAAPTSLSIASASSDIFGASDSAVRPLVWTEQWVPGMDYKAPQISKAGPSLLLPPQASKASYEPHLAWLSTDTTSVISTNNPNPLICIRDAPPPGFLKSALLQGNCATALHLPFNQAFTNFLPRSSETDTRKVQQGNHLQEIQPQILEKSLPTAPIASRTRPHRSQDIINETEPENTTHGPTTFSHAPNVINQFDLPSYHPLAISSKRETPIFHTEEIIKAPKSGSRPPPPKKRGRAKRVAAVAETTPIPLSAQYDTEASPVVVNPEVTVRRKKKRKRLDWMMDDLVHDPHPARSEASNEWLGEDDEAYKPIRNTKRPKVQKDEFHENDDYRPRNDDNGTYSPADEIGRSEDEYPSPRDLYETGAEAIYEKSLRTPSNALQHADDIASMATGHSHIHDSAPTRQYVAPTRGGKAARGTRRSRQKTRALAELAPLTEGPRHLSDISMPGTYDPNDDSWDPYELMLFRIICFRLSVDDLAAAVVSHPTLSAASLADTVLRSPNWERLKARFEELSAVRPKSMFQIQSKYARTHAVGNTKIRWSADDEEVMLALVLINPNLRLVAGALGRTAAAVASRLTNRFDITIDHRAECAVDTHTADIPKSVSRLIQASFPPSPLDHASPSSLPHSHTSQAPSDDSNMDISEDRDSDSPVDILSISPPLNHAYQPSSTISQNDIPPILEVSEKMDPDSSRLEPESIITSTAAPIASPLPHKSIIRVPTPSSDLGWEESRQTELADFRPSKIEDTASTPTTVTKDEISAALPDSSDQNAPNETLFSTSPVTSLSAASLSPSIPTVAPVTRSGMKITIRSFTSKPPSLQTPVSSETSPTHPTQVGDASASDVHHPQDGADASADETVPQSP